MRSQSPPESTHALDVEALRGADITFLALRDAGGRLLGVGALKRHGDGTGEIKSMHVSSAARGRGLGHVILKAIEAEACAGGIRRLSLETGAPDGFAAGRGLYASNGYLPCAPFADYAPDPFSVFMTKSLDLDGGNASVSS